jgi:hypothetical protein
VGKVLLTATDPSSGVGGSCSTSGPVPHPIPTQSVWHHRLAWETRSEGFKGAATVRVWVPLSVYTRGSEQQTPSVSSSSLTAKMIVGTRLSAFTTALASAVGTTPLPDLPRPSKPVHITPPSHHPGLTVGVCAVGGDEDSQGIIEPLRSGRHGSREGERGGGSGLQEGRVRLSYVCGTKTTDMVCCSGLLYVCGAKSTDSECCSGPHLLPRRRLRDAVGGRAVGGVAHAIGGPPGDHGGAHREPGPTGQAAGAHHRYGRCYRAGNGRAGVGGRGVRVADNQAAATGGREGARPGGGTQ